jgi:uncharacterized protein (DUF4415 family)
MKPAKRGKRRGIAKGKAARGKIASLRASGDQVKRPRDWSAEVPELYRPLKKPVTLRLDADVLAWFKKQGRGYQTRINRALRKLMTAEFESGERG